MKWYSVLLLVTPLLVRLGMDGHKILVQKKEVNHGKQFTLSVMITAVVSYLVWRIEPVQTYFQVFIVSGSFFWLVFDHALNLIRGKSFFYIDANAVSGKGPSSFADRVYLFFGMVGVFFWKCVLFTASVACYVMWDLITKS